MFACPPGRMLGNGTGKLRGGWGEVRGRNGIIVVAPSTHQKAAAGGRYVWQRTGPVPVLPAELAELLPDALDADDAATDADVRAFLAEHAGSAARRPCGALAEVPGRRRGRRLPARAAVDATVWGLKEARAGYYPAAAVVEQIGAAFVDALKGERPSEYAGIVAWAVAQAKAADLDEVRRIADRPRNDDPADLIADAGPAPPGLVEPDEPDPPEPSADPAAKSHIASAHRLASDYADRLRHAHGLGWHVWDGTRWAPDRDGAAWRAAAAVLVEGTDTAAGQRASDLRGVLDIAARLHPLTLPAERLDADPELLNTPTGTLDLRTGELRPHNPADHISKRTGAPYIPVADGPRWLQFLAETLPDPDVRGFVQRLAGLALLGRVVEHVLPVWVGPGGTGKGTLYGLLLAALGDYGITVDPELVIEQRHAQHPTGLADLHGVRLAVTSETDRGRRLAAAPSEAHRRRPHPRPANASGLVRVAPSHTLILVSNDRPIVDGNDSGMWRRCLPGRHRPVPRRPHHPVAVRARPCPRPVRRLVDVVPPDRGSGRLRSHLRRGSRPPRHPQGQAQLDGLRRTHARGRGGRRVTTSVPECPTRGRRGGSAARPHTRAHARMGGTGKPSPALPRRGPGMTNTGRARDAGLRVVAAALDALSLTSDRLTRPGGPTTLRAALYAVHTAADALAELCADRLDQPIPPDTDPRR